MLAAAALSTPSPSKIIVIGAGEVSKHRILELIDELDENVQVEIVSAATASTLYGYVPEPPEPEPPDMRAILEALPIPIPSMIDEEDDRERRDRAASRVHRPHTSFGTFGRLPMLGTLGAAIASASMLALYPTRRPYQKPVDPDFLTEEEVEAREAGSMVHDVSEKLVMSAAEEKRARKAAKRAENEAKARAGRGT